jgi:hypothetical protein
MRYGIGTFAGAALLAAVLNAQQPQQSQPSPQPPPAPQPQVPATGGQPAKAPEPPYTIYRVELVGGAFGFAMNEPVLEGDVWVFRSLPDKSLERVPKSKVKAVTRWSTDYDKEVVFQVELVPTGSVLAREEPVKKGRGYTLTTWKQGQLLSVKEEDVKKISRLTGFPAFKAEMLELGVVVLEHDTTLTGFKQTGDAPAAGAPGQQGQGARPGQGNWTYQGTPGASDAYAPGNATVAKPGDTPMMPAPTRPPQ